jgi:CYTH domain-containing protein
VVEVEFSSQEESEAFQPPEGWREVTEDPAYTNTSLALRPKVGWV